MMKAIKILQAGVAVLSVISTVSVHADAWMDHFYHEMDCNMLYPAEALAQGEFGVVRLGFRLDVAGGLVEIKVISSSGSSLLDTSAIDLVRRSIPSFPPSNNKGRYKYEMNVRFNPPGPSGNKKRPDNCVDNSTGIPTS
jgi:TonB family protein